MANVDQIDQFSSKYKVRRNQQMFRFFGSTLITLASCRLAIRGIKLKKCMYSKKFYVLFDALNFNY